MRRGQPTHSDQPVLQARAGIFKIIRCCSGAGLTLSENFWPLMTFRFLQAAGAGVGTVIARGFISNQMTPKAALKAFATLTAVMGFTPIVAPIVAGYLLIAANFQTVFGLLFFARPADSGRLLVPDSALS